MPGSKVTWRKKPSASRRTDDQLPNGGSWGRCRRPTAQSTSWTSHLGGESSTWQYQGRCTPKRRPHEYSAASSGNHQVESNRAQRAPGEKLRRHYQGGPPSRTGPHHTMEHAAPEGRNHTSLERHPPRAAQDPERHQGPTEKRGSPRPSRSRSVRVPKRTNALGHDSWALRVRSPAWAWGTCVGTCMVLRAVRSAMQQNAKLNFVLSHYRSNDAQSNPHALHGCKEPDATPALEHNPASRVSGGEAQERAVEGC